MREDIQLAIDALEDLRAWMTRANQRWPYRVSLAAMNEDVEVAYRAISRVAAVLEPTKGGDSAEE